MIKKDDNCYIVDDEEYFSFLKNRKTLTKVIKKSEVKNILFGEVDYKAYISVAKKYNISYDLAKIYVDNALFLKENIDLVSAPNSVKILCEIKEFLTSQNMIYFSSRINILKKGIVLYGNPCDFIDIIPVLNDKKIPFTEEYRQMEEKDIDEFRRRLNADAELTEEDFVPKIWIDVPMPFEYVNEKIVQELKDLEPFGQGNEKPLFAQKSLVIRNARVLGKNRNVVKLNLVTETGQPVDGLLFADGDRFLEEQAGRNMIDMIYYPDVNEYNGTRTLQAVIRNYKFH